MSKFRSSCAHSTFAVAHVLPADNLKYSKANALPTPLQIHLPLRHTPASSFDPPARIREVLPAQTLTLATGHYPARARPVSVCLECEKHADEQLAAARLAHPRRHHQSSPLAMGSSAKHCSTLRARPQTISRFLAERCKAAVIAVATVVSGEEDWGGGPVATAAAAAAAVRSEASTRQWMDCHRVNLCSHLLGAAAIPRQDSQVRTRPKRKKRSRRSRHLARWDTTEYQPQCHQERKR
eukprot:scaffold117158_cov32-Tisochrysis_lutea.AAC.6